MKRLSRRAFRTFAVSLALAAGMTLEARAGDVPPLSPSGGTLTPEQHAEALLARIRCGDPRLRDEAMRELLELAAVEDSAPPGPRPVHVVLANALGDPDVELRFRVRRILGDPEVRVERVLQLLMEPAPTELVKATQQGLLGRADRAVARAGLVKLARRAARAGMDPATNRSSEVWKPYGLFGGVQLRERRRFHVAVDLLGTPASDEEAAQTVDLLREDLGDSLFDVIAALASRPRAACAAAHALVEDRNPVVRENVAWTLGQIGNAEDAPTLEKLLADGNARVRRAAVTAFEMLPIDGGACTKAAGLANDADPQVAAAALHLGASRGHRFVAEAAARYLSSPAPIAPELKIQAIKALGRLGDPAGVLRKLGEKPDETARFVSWATGTAGDQEGLGALEALTTKDEFAFEPGIYYGFARAGAVSVLERLARSDKDDLRRLAIQALGSAKGDPGEIADLLRTCGTRALERGGARAGDWNDFITAFRALRDRNDDAAHRSLGVLLDQALGTAARAQGFGEQELYYALQYAKQAGAKECVRAVENVAIYGGHNTYVRAEAMDALSTIDPPRARKTLGQLVDRETHPELRAVLARSLARAGDRTYVSRALDYSRVRVARAAQPNQQGAEFINFSDALNTEGIDHAYAANLDEAMLCFRRMRWLRPDNNVASYNVACVLSLHGHLDRAMLWLRRSILEGFKNWRHIQGDGDLIPLLQDPRFLRIIEDLRLDQEIEPQSER